MWRIWMCRFDGQGCRGGGRCRVRCLGVGRSIEDGAWVRYAREDIWPGVGAGWVGTSKTLEHSVALGFPHSYRS